MKTIIDVKKAVLKFLKENIKCYDISVIKIEKVNDLWKAISEVYEDDSFLKAMNMPTKQIRLFYCVKMDENLVITSYERFTSFSGMDGTEE